MPSAPMARAKAAFSSELTVPITVMPESFASCTSDEPTPPAAPMTRTDFGGRAAPHSFSSAQAT